MEWRQTGPCENTIDGGKCNAACPKKNVSSLKCNETIRRAARKDENNKWNENNGPAVFLHNQRWEERERGGGKKGKTKWRMDLVNKSNDQSTRVCGISVHIWEAAASFADTVHVQELIYVPDHSRHLWRISCWLLSFHFGNCAKCFIHYWGGMCPRGTPLYEKCIQTDVSLLPHKTHGSRQRID